MPETQPWYDDVAIPYLMRLARGSYGERSRSLLARAGFDDLPRNAGFVLGGLVDGPGPLSEIVEELFVSASAAAAMIDTLVLRGYLERRGDPEDPRRTMVALTERGRGAAAAIQTAVDRIDAELAQRLSPQQLDGLRAGLAALHEIREAGCAADDPPA